jgi:hypothetical protein
MGALKDHQCFLSNDPFHVGQVKIPIGRLVAFPNIEKEEFCRRSLEGLIPLPSVFFKEDFEATSEIYRDTSGNKFHEKVCGVCKFPFEGLTEPEIGKLKASLWPEIRIDLPERKGM